MSEKRHDYAAFGIGVPLMSDDGWITVADGTVLDFPGGKRIEVDRVTREWVYYRAWHHSAPQDAQWLRMKPEEFGEAVRMHGGKQWFA